MKKTRVWLLIFLVFIVLFSLLFAIVFVVAPTVFIYYRMKKKTMKEAESVQPQRTRFIRIFQSLVISIVYQ